MNVFESRIRGIQDNNLSFNETMLSERNRFFDWIKGPQARIRDGKQPEEQDVAHMIETYTRWATLSSANRTWLTAQLDGLTREITTARDRQWSPESQPRASALLQEGAAMSEEVRDLIRLRGELFEDCSAEANKLRKSSRALFGK